MLAILSGDVAVGRPILTSPQVPADRLQALRRAFDETMRDPLFVDAVRKGNMDINPIGGEALQQAVAQIVSASPEIVAKVKEAIRIKDVRPLPPGQAPKGGAAESKD